MDEELASGPAIAETNVEVSTETPPVAESAPATPEAREPESKDKIQERFDKLTREKYDALRAADTERYQRERLEERLKALETKAEPVVPAELPTLEAYGFDETKYRVALAEYYKADARKEVQSVLQQEREALKAQERRSAFEKRQAEFIASKPDYADKVLRNNALPISSDMAAAIQDSEFGPQVAYYLSENVDKALLISHMPVSSQLREIGRIEARFEAAKAVSAPPVSKAPPPPPTLGASEPALRITPDSPESDSAWSADEWRKRRDKQAHKRK